MTAKTKGLRAHAEDGARHGKTKRAKRPNPHVMGESIFELRPEPLKTLCGSCKFFVPGMDPEGVGECRRFPPQVFYTSGVGYSAGFALVKPVQWCGEFQKRGKKS
jgi:hypothetical protein